LILHVTQGKQNTFTLQVHTRNTEHFDTLV